MGVTRSHIFYDYRLRDIPDGIKKWKGMDEKSQLLDDNGKPIEK